MAQEDKNVTIPPEMMQEIVRVASETAIEKFQHEASGTERPSRTSACIIPSCCFRTTTAL